MSDRTAAFSAPRSAVWIAIASLVIALLLPILNTSQRIDAAQILDRRIDMQSSQINAETSYEVDFQIPDTATFGTVRVEFCNENPIPGAACNVSTTEGTTVPELDADGGSAITITNWAMGGSLGDTTDAATNCTAANAALATTHTAATNLTHFDIECGTGNAETISAGTNDFVHFTVNNIDNPSNAVNDSFYARIYTFASADTPGVYAAAAPPLGNYEGGLALSTAQTIDIEARVQESLTFTVGVDGAADDCVAIAGSTVELGVLDTGINLASTDGFDTLSPNTDVICAEVSTNASNGVVVSYVGDNLSIGSASCTNLATDKDDTDTIDDDCINRDDTVSVPDPIVGGSEQWGLGVSDLSEYGSITNVMTAAAEYDIGGANEYAFVPNAVTQIASSTGVLDQATVEIDVAGTASVTTPTGVYDTTLTFIATSSF